jgi:hypothetical protein
VPVQVVHPQVEEDGHPGAKAVDPFQLEAGKLRHRHLRLVHHADQGRVHVAPLEGPKPLARRRWAVKRVVLVFPAVPVMPMMGVGESR